MILNKNHLLYIAVLNHQQEGKSSPQVKIYTFLQENIGLVELWIV